LDLQSLDVISICVHHIAEKNGNTNPVITTTAIIINININITSAGRVKSLNEN